MSLNKLIIKYSTDKRAIFQLTLGEGFKSQSQIVIQPIRLILESITIT